MLVLDTYTPCDACDACHTARAHVILTQPSSTWATLALCGHHYGVHATMLAVYGWQVTEDTRATLLARPTSDVDADAAPAPTTTTTTTTPPDAATV